MVENNEQVDSMESTDVEKAPEEVIKEEFVANHNFATKYPFSKLSTTVNDYSSYLILPGIDKDELGEYLKTFNKAIVNNEFNNTNEALFKTNVDKVFNHKGISYTTPNNEYTSLIKEGGFFNDVSFGGTDIGINKIGIKPTTNVNNNIALFMNKVRNVTGLGSTIQIPLWNSGIWLTINPPKNNDLVYIQNKLAEEALIVGRESSKVLGGTENFILERAVADFVLDTLLVNTTLKLKDDEDIRSYILNSDLQSIVIGVVSTMYPDGFTITRSCKNSFIILEDGSRKCNHFINGLINPKYMLHKNSKKISKDMLSHMSKRQPNSVTPEEVKEYQSLNSTIQDVEKEIALENGDKLFVTVGTPNIEEYNSACSLWYDEIISQLERLLEKADDLEDKNQKAFNLMRTNYLSYFLPYVRSIKQVDVNGEVLYDSKEVIEDKRAMANMEILNTISVDGFLLKEVEIVVKDYSRSNTLVVVAGPDYICPSCNTPQGDSSVKHSDFENLIPIDAMMVFFALSAIRSKMA